MDIPKEEREKEAGSLFKEMIPEKFPKPGEGMDIQVHEANQLIFSMQKDLLQDTLS